MTHSPSALAHLLDLPAGEPWAGIVILHGAGSRKENHADMAAAATAAGFATVRFDMRGHGSTGGVLDGRALDDVALAAELLPPGLRFALRGSSMGGYLALVAAEHVGASAVVAVCPAPAPLLAQGLSVGDLEFPADAAAVAALLAAHPLDGAVAALELPVLIQHAEDDEQVPVEGSRELAQLLRHPASRLDALPGGDHRSVQHDPGAQAAALRWLRYTLGRR